MAYCHGWIHKTFALKLVEGCCIMYFSTKQLLGTCNLGSLVSESVLDQSMLSEGLAKTWSLAYFSTLPWLRFDEFTVVWSPYIHWSGNGCRATLELTH